MKKLVIIALYRSPLTVTLWPSSFLKKYGPMIPPAHKAHQTFPHHLHQLKPIYFPLNIISNTNNTIRIAQPPISNSSTSTSTDNILHTPVSPLSTEACSFPSTSDKFTALSTETRPSVPLLETAATAFNS
ncbi:hypothetical protein TNCV_1350111 [Trichonephila clavipes]|nr:hypothetical protein TNCV_1350111 [Trichonephila clavipes]